VTDEELIELERSRIDAMVANDLDKVDALLDEDYEFFHGDGRYSNRATFLEELRSRTIRYHALGVADAHAFVLGDFGVIFYTLALHVDAYGMKDLHSKRDVTSVWRSRNGCWRLVILRGIRAEGMK
jgi:hypothetical protein